MPGPSLGGGGGQGRLRTRGEGSAKPHLSKPPAGRHPGQRKAVPAPVPVPLFASPPPLGQPGAEGGCARLAQTLQMVPRALGYIPEWPLSCVGPGAPEGWAHSLSSPAWRRTSSRGENSSGRPCASTSGWRPPERSPGETGPVGCGGEPACWGPSEDTRSQEQLGCNTRAPGPSTWALPASAGWQGASLCSYGRALKPAASWAAPALPGSLSARFPSGHR